MVEYKVDLDDVELTLFELLDLRELAAIPRYAGQTVEEYRAILREAAALAKRDLAAVNERGDREGAQVVDGRVRMPEGFRDAWRKLGEMGLGAMDLSPRSGGLGLPALMYGAVTELVKLLQGKIEVARFHVTQLLPGADADIARVASDDRSALADVL